MAAASTVGSVSGNQPRHDFMTARIVSKGILVEDVFIPQQVSQNVVQPRLGVEKHFKPLLPCISCPFTSRRAGANEFVHGVDDACQ